MGRISEPVSLRTGFVEYWCFQYYGTEKPYMFLQNYWLLHSFRKLFEKTRERITLLSNFAWGKHFLSAHVLLLMTEKGYIRKRQRLLKRRIIFILFKRFVYRAHFRKKKIFHSHYAKILRFVSNTNRRFLSYCKLACNKLGKALLARLLNTVPFRLKPKTALELPLRLRVGNFFSAMDRAYTLVWRHFSNVAFGQMWFARKTRYFHSTLKLSFIFLFLPSARLFANHIAYLLKKSRQHWQIIKTLKQLIALMVTFLPNFQKIKIRISGCIQDAERTRSAILGQTSIVLQTFSAQLDYALAHAATPFGALGVKVWIIK